MNSTDALLATRINERSGSPSPKRRRKIACQICERLPSNPEHDGKSTWTHTDKPVYICDQCQDDQDNDIEQEFGEQD